MSSEFPIEAGLSVLNHASFGVPTNHSLSLAARVRRRIDADATRALWPPLTDALRELDESTAAWLGLSAGEFTLTPNPTSSAAAVASSMPLRSGGRAVVLSSEYPSVIRGWQVATERAGAICQIVRVPVVLGSGADVLAALDEQVSGPVDIVQISLITSPTASTMPVGAIATWVRKRGGTLIVDAAHGPGHVALDELAEHAAIAFGSLHKWLPVPRAVGFLWVSPRCDQVIRPAEVSLSWDAERLSDRFAWPGTFDPAPRLCLPDAIEQWTAWHRAGLLDRAARLSAHATVELEALGGICTAPPALRPPRLQAVLLPGVELDRLRAACDERDVRVWAESVGDAGETVLRLSTHVYNDEGDVERVLNAVRAAGRGDQGR